LREKKMQTIYIVSSGSFYRPVDTPAGKAGWIGEIVFWYPPDFSEKKIPTISQVFDTKKEADEFVIEELFKLYDNPEYRFRDYSSKR
jgi:hypothetical protein